jgi:hypothetical protein
MLICGAAVLALAGCSKAGDKAANGGQAATPAAGDAAKTASADTGAPPSRKAGLWEQTMAFNGMKQTMRMCVDEATEQKARWWRTERRGGGEVNCPEQKVSRSLAGGWTIHSVCHEPNGMTVTSDGTASGDFGQSYHVDMTTVTSGSSMPEANGTHHMVMDGAWKGPCPAGMAAGDMEMPGGMRISASGAPAGGAGGPPDAAGMAKRFSADHPPSQADIAQMRAQAMEMAKKYKEGAQ